MQAGRGLAVGVEVEDHLGAFPRRPTRPGAGVEGIEPRPRDAQQCVGPGHVARITPVAAAVAGVPQPELTVATHLQRAATWRNRSDATILAIARGEPEGGNTL